MSKESLEILRVPMLVCLKRVIGELADKLQGINELVEKRTGQKLDLKIVSVDQIKKEDFRIKVSGITTSKRETEEEFQVLWWSNTCPTYFHLLQRDRIAYSCGHEFIYRGLVDARSEILGREVAIWTHRMQIPGVLSRVM